MVRWQGEMGDEKAARRPEGAVPGFVCWRHSSFYRDLVL